MIINQIDLVCAWKCGGLEATVANAENQIKDALLASGSKAHYYFDDLKTTTLPHKHSTHPA